MIGDVGSSDDRQTAAAVDCLAAHNDFRILRRLQSVSRFHDPIPENGDLRIGVAIDVETTGLDHTKDKIIELAIQRFRFDRAGRIVEVGTPRVWQEDPGIPISPTITNLTGLTTADLAGQSIDDQLATEILKTADIIVAHNASFDRPFVDQRLPAVSELRWACSINEVDWRELGFDGRALSHLLAQCGWFYQGHRADADVLALLYLLAHTVSDDATILSKLLARADEPTFRCEAIDSAFDTKDRLKARGYRWDSAQRIWSTELRLGEVDDERAWLAAEVYMSGGGPRLTKLTAMERYRTMPTIAIKTGS